MKDQITKEEIKQDIKDYQYAIDTRLKMQALENELVNRLMKKYDRSDVLENRFRLMEHMKLKLADTILKE